MGSLQGFGLRKLLQRGFLLSWSLKIGLGISERGQIILGNSKSTSKSWTCMNIFSNPMTGIIKYIKHYTHIEFVPVLQIWKLMKKLKVLDQMWRIQDPLGLSCSKRLQYKSNQSASHNALYAMSVEITFDFQCMFQETLVHQATI